MIDPDCFTLSIGVDVASDGFTAQVFSNGNPSGPIVTVNGGFAALDLQEVFFNALSRELMLISHSVRPTPPLIPEADALARELDLGPAHIEDRDVAEWLNRVAAPPEPFRAEDVVWSRASLRQNPLLSEVKDRHFGLLAKLASESLSVGGVGSPTVATGGEAASLPAASAEPALCTTCDHRLDDASIRACSVRDCPHAQREAA